MSGNFKKEDLRIIKTQRALVGSLRTLLEKQSFKRTTVNDICEEALISRATFYAHFYDKYDLLSYFMNSLRQEILQDVKREHASEIEGYSPPYVSSRLINNVLVDNDKEVFDIFLKFMESVICEYMNKSDMQARPDGALFVRFCAGGVISMLTLLVGPECPAEPQKMWIDAFRVLRTVIDENAGSFSCSTP